jgi:RNA polymerase sigma-70 factor (ECF subfamily)
MAAVNLRLISTPEPATSAAAETDAALVERMATGDRVALGALFDRHHHGLYSFLARTSGASDAEIEDLVQTAFLEAFRSAPRFRGAASPRTWLFAIGSNLARMHQRATRRRDRALQRLADLPASSPVTLDTQLADQRALTRIQAALAELPHDLRIAYAMCVLEDVPADEAARALGVRRGTIWRRVHAARQALRAAVDARGRP